MNFYDFLIIYLACGAPVSVYFYFQNRRLYSKQLWLKTILNFLFWIPFFVQLLLKRQIRANSRKNGFKSNTISNVNDNRIQNLKREIENILVESRLKLSIYEFREVFERFAGLTIARYNNNSKPYKHEKEFYRVSSFNNQELSAGCLHRRNQKRLYFHQTEAEKDFLKVIAAISDSTEKTADLRKLTFELVELLNNSGARKTLEKIFDAKLQTNYVKTVIELEKDLWIPETLKPPTVKKVSMRSQPTQTRARSFAGD